MCIYCYVHEHASADCHAWEDIAAENEPLQQHTRHLCEEQNRAVSGVQDATPDDIPKSRLLALPLELRTMIYEYAIDGSTIVVLEVCKGVQFDPDITIGCSTKLKIGCREPGQRRRSATELLNLSLVSPQIHAETRLLPFALNEFSFLYSFNYNSTPLSASLPEEFTPDQLKAIRSVRVQLWCLGCDIRVELSNMPFKIFGGLRRVTVEVFASSRTQVIEAGGASEIKRLVGEMVGPSIQVSVVQRIFDELLL
jgi:hypothetical protein